MNKPIQPEGTQAADAAAIFATVRETLAEIRVGLDALASRIESEQGVTA